MIALVRGVHGLGGAVRVEVLTDHPERRFVPDAVLFREGDAAPLTIASAEAVVDGPGWRVQFREIGSRDRADTLRGVYLESVVPADDGLGRGEYYWHEVIGTAVHGTDGAELGTVQDIYRLGETEVFPVGGGPMAPFDVPAVRAFIRVFAPRRGEIVVDAESLDLRPAKSRTPDPDRPKAPRRRSRRKSASTGPTAGTTDSPETADPPEAVDAPEASGASDGPAADDSLDSPATGS